MILTDFTFSILIAIVLTIVLTGLFRWRRPGRDSFITNLIFVFALFFLFAWLGGTWMTPVGPVLWGSYWLTFLVFPIFIGLVLLILVPPKSVKTTRRRVDQENEEAAVGSVLGFFFWMLFICMLVFILLHYAASG